VRRVLFGSAVLAILLLSLVVRAENQAEFITGLTAKESVTVADGVRGVAFAISGEGTILPFDQALSALGQRDITNKKWDLKADAPLTKGKLAVMLFNAAGLKKGLGDVLFGLSERTALKECANNGLMGGGRPGEEVGGGVALVVSLHGLATRLRAKGGAQGDLVKIDIEAVEPKVSEETKAAQGRVILAVTAGVMPASTKISGLIAAVQRDVWIMPAGKAWTPAREGAAVAVGTQVFTGIDGQAEISFPDGTILLMRPFTELELVSAGSGQSKGGTFYTIKAASSFGTVRVRVGSKGFLSIIQVGSPTSYVTALDGAFEQTAAGSLSETRYRGSKGRISVVQGSW